MKLFQEIVKCKENKSTLHHDQQITSLLKQLQAIDIYDFLKSSRSILYNDKFRFVENKLWNL